MNKRERLSFSFQSHEKTTKSLRLAPVLFRHANAPSLISQKMDLIMKLSFTRNTVRFGALFTAALALTACQSGNSAQEELEQANLEKALYCANVLEVELDIEKARRECIGSTYIQHSSHVPDGKDGLLTYFEGRIKKFPKMRAEIKRAGADGDLVWMHVHFKKTPESRGNAVINIFRMEDGKLVEHWGVGQPVSEKSVHDNTMF